MKYVILTLVTLSALVFAQEPSEIPTDSLELQLKSAKGTKRVQILNLLFKAYINQDPVRATGYTKEALSLAMEFEDSNGIGASYNNLGVAYKNQGALDKALENYLTAEAVYKNAGIKEGAAATHNNIGTIYSLKKDYEKAKKYFNESLETFSLIKDSLRIIGILNNLGNVYSDLGKYQEALTYFNQSTQIADQLDIKPIDPLLNIGNVLVRQNKPMEAINYLNKAIELAEQEQNQLALMTIKTSLANAWLANGDSKAAEISLKEALELCKKLNAYFLEPQILQTLAETYAKQNRMSDAYNYMLAYDQAREAVYSDESGRRIAQMEMVIDIQEKEKQIEHLQQEEELQAIQLQRTQLAVTVAIISILLITLGINAYLQRRKTK